MTFELTRIKQRLADLEKNQEKLLKVISEINLTMIVIQEEINTINKYINVKLLLKEMLDYDI